MTENHTLGNKTLGVLSDTHLSDIKDCADLANFLIAGPFKDVDMILHAGDHTSADLEACFYPIPFLSVRGNMDHQLTDLPQYRILNINNYNIALIHGWGHPDGLEERILTLFAGQSLDVIIYGHSHFPVCHRINNTLMFNPGSPTDKRRSPIYSVGILQLGDKVQGFHVEIDNLSS